MKRRLQRRAVDDERLGVAALRFERRKHQALDRVGDVVRPVEHMGRVEVGRPALRRVDEFVERPEQAERIDRARVEVVVAVFRIVEMKARQASDADETRDDLLDVDGRRMMAKVDEATRLWDAGSPRPSRRV